AVAGGVARTRGAGGHLPGDRVERERATGGHQGTRPRRAGGVRGGGAPRDRRMADGRRSQRARRRAAGHRALERVGRRVRGRRAVAVLDVGRQERGLVRAVGGDWASPGSSRGDDLFAIASRTQSLLTATSPPWVRGSGAGTLTLRT